MHVESCRVICLEFELHISCLSYCYLVKARFPFRPCKMGLGTASLPGVVLMQHVKAQPEMLSSHNGALAAVPAASVLISSLPQSLGKQ